MKKKLRRHIKKLKKRFRRLPQLRIVLYRAYASTSQLYCRGRVLVNPTIISTIKDSSWRNFINNYRRFRTDEIPQAILNIHFGQEKFEVVTDTDGYFHLYTSIQPTTAYQLHWQKIYADLTYAPIKAFRPPITEGEVLVPSPSAQFGVISDIDDTILQTYVAAPLKMLYTTFFKNAHSRLPMIAASDFYQALQKGKTGVENNPIFYVSKSPFNLYDMLDQFMSINRMPKGPMLLRNFGLPKKDMPAPIYGHKHQEIVHILNMYPNLPFILIGDSGEKDADLYQHIANEFPNRIKAIYIRCINDKKRAKRIQQLIETEQNVPMLLIKHSIEAAYHAAAQGWIDPQTLSKIKKK